MSRENQPQILPDESEDWKNTEELLDGGSDNVGVLSLNSGTEALNGSVKELEPLQLYIDEVDAVRGDYMIFPEYMIDGVDEQMGSQTLRAEDANDANFYVGQSTGVPWFELKFEQEYDIPDREEPHVHNAWEFYSFHEGEGLLDVAGSEYDFSRQDPESWEERDDVDQVYIPEGGVLGVPPGVPHKANSQYGNPLLVVARYTSEGDIGRFNLKGERVDPWSEDAQEVDMVTYPEALE